MFWSRFIGNVQERWQYKIKRIPAAILLSLQSEVIIVRIQYCLNDAVEV